MTDKKTTTKKRSEKVREELATVQIFARTGRLPIVEPTEEFISPTRTRKIPGIVLLFEDGVCTLDPKRNAVEIKAFREWMAEGTDPRILQLGVTEVKADALLPPFPKWDTTNPDKLAGIVDDLGLDVEKCLRYELGKDTPRTKIVKALEAKLDEPVAEGVDAAEPVL